MTVICIITAGLAGPPGVRPSYPNQGPGAPAKRLDPDTIPSPIQVKP